MKTARGQQENSKQNESLAVFYILFYILRCNIRLKRKIVAEKVAVQRAVSVRCVEPLKTRYGLIQFFNFGPITGGAFAHLSAKLYQCKA